MGPGQLFKTIDVRIERTYTPSHMLYLVFRILMETTLISYLYMCIMFTLYQMIYMIREYFQT